MVGHAAGYVRAVLPARRLVRDAARRRTDPPCANGRRATGGGAVAADRRRGPSDRSAGDQRGAGESRPDRFDPRRRIRRHAGGAQESYRARAEGDDGDHWFRWHGPGGARQGHSHAR